MKNKDKRVGFKYKYHTMTDTKVGGKEEWGLGS